MEDVIRLVITVVGAVGILLGLYGLFMPAIRSRLAAWKLKRSAAHADEEDGDYDLPILAGAQFLGDAVLPIPPAPPVREVTPLPVVVVAASPPPPSADAAPEAISLDAEGNEEESSQEEFTEPTVMTNSESDQAVDPDQTGEIVADATKAAETEADDGVTSLATSADDGLLALFDDSSEHSTLPDSVKDSIQNVEMNELLGEARQLWEFLSARRTA